MRTLLFVALLAIAAPVAAQEWDTKAHPCDQLEQRLAHLDVTGKPAPLIYNPIVGQAHTLAFCGDLAQEPLDCTLTIDAVVAACPKPLQLVRYFYGDAWKGVCGQNGQCAYVAPGTITLPSPGPHTIRVVYGADKKVATFTWIGSTCVGPGAPLGVATINCGRPQ